MKNKIQKTKIIYPIFLIFKHLYLSFYYGIFMNVFKLFKIKNNKIVISNYYGKGYGDNAKYVCDELLKMNEKFDIVWLCKNINDKSVPTGIRKVKYNSIKALYELSTAKIWMDNCRKSYHIIKRSGQYYIQLWHGCTMLKKIEFDVQDKLGKYYTRNMIKDNEICDLFISNSKYFSKRCRESFKFEGKILEAGEPKGDVLLNNHNKMATEFKEKNGLVNSIIILYAPTFRMDYSSNPYDIDFQSIAESFKKKGLNVKVLVRLHPNITSESFNFKFNKDIIDMSKYPDMQELLAASDILITDYSSIMFESMLIDKNVILYVKDIDSYCDDRGFYFNLEELPFSMVKNNDDLLDVLDNFNGFNPDVYQKMKEEIGLFDKRCSAVSLSNLIKNIVLKGD